MSVKEVKNEIKKPAILFCKGATKSDRKKSDAGVDDVHDSPWLAYKSLMSISIAGIFRVFSYIF